MGYNKLCLLLLLSSYTVAQDYIDSEQTPCLLASRFQSLKKYVYQYTAESQNGIVGASNLRNGPKVTCRVEIEASSACLLIMNTMDCSLSEASDTDAQGQPLYTQAPGSDAFKDAMEKNPLKFSVADVTKVEIFPETDEAVNILNIKSGILSALIVPLLEDDRSSLMNTVHGKCMTHYSVNMDTVPGVALHRDLSQCDQFHARALPNSPLALLQKLHSPLSKLITSSQNCNYQFDNNGNHITFGKCTEKHLYLPFSHGESGMSSVVSQELTLINTEMINARIVDVDPDQRRPLHFEDPDDKSQVQTKEAVLSIFRDLADLASTDEGHRRTGLFHKLVSGLRVMRNETLSQTVMDMYDISGWLTWQALFQCGTSECTSAILQILRTIDGLAWELDALVYGLGLQADPNEDRVRDMLSMAEFKQSKAIMYALANTVEKFHKSERSPIVTDVSNFMEMLLDECSGADRDPESEYYIDPEETYFLVLKVVGVMGRAMQDVSPGLISSISQCAKKIDMSLSTRKAAIRAFRMMEKTDEIKNVLMEVFRDSQNPVEMRVAAYMILMENGDVQILQEITKALENESDEQLWSFVLSHLNKLSTKDRELIWFIREFLEKTPSDAYNKVSGIYQTFVPFGSVQSNIVFDAGDKFPKDMVLEGKVNPFGDDYVFVEVGVEGKGIDPMFDALFGEDGFFSEIYSKIMDRVSPQQNRMKRETLQRDVSAVLEKLMNDVRESSPEAIAYLRLLGKEIGYMKTKEIIEILRTLSLYQHVFTQILPAQVLLELTTKTENPVFGHYIFMENAFSLPTGSGFPLKYSLAGVFAPGAKGGVIPSSMTELLFRPSVGLEFITEMGVHIPDFVDAGIEMHTTMFHESSLNAQITMKRNQVKLTLPAPTKNTQLFSISNELLSVSSGQTKKVPSLVEDKAESTECQPLISGLNLCTITLYPNASASAPYFPLTGEAKFAVEIRPTGKVSQYTATISDETLREGKKGRHKVETLKLTLQTEGDETSQATIALKYNRNKQVLSSEVVIPDFDVEAGIKLAVSDSDTNGMKMRGVTIDVTNKNIPQMTLVGRTRLDKMRDVILQLQMIIPSLNADASITANLKKAENLLMDLETVVHLPETSYQQKAALKYDDDKVEVELKSDFNSEIQKLIPDLENHHRQLQQLMDNILDQKVAKTDMKLRHIVTKGIEAANIWLDKLTANVPYFANLRSKRSTSDLTLPALPEKLFLQSDSLFRYQFNKERMAISLPLPFGGKKSEELNIPNTLSVPLIDVPELGLHIPANNYQLPTFTIPPSLDFTVPLIGLAELSSQINSNIYSWEGSISGGNNTVDIPSYIAQYKAIAQSPLCLLSYKLEGTGMMSGRPDDNLKYLLNSSFSNCLIDTSFSVSESLRVTDKLHARANYKVEAVSPLGLQGSLSYSARSTSTLNSDDVSGDGTVDGSLKLGSFHASSSYANSYNLRPLDREGRGESTLNFDSPLIQFENKIQGVYANEELNIVSTTNAQKDIFKHAAELKYKNSQLTLKCNAVAKALGKSLNNKVELGVSSDMGLFRVESQAEDDKNRAYSLLTGLLDSNGLEVNSEGSLILDMGRGLHKASVKVNGDGLSTSGTNSFQCSPLTLENIFNGAIDSNGATLSCTTKALTEEGRGEMNIEGKILPTEASLNCDLKGHAYDGSTANNMNVVLNRRGLTLTGDAKGTMGEMNTDNSHSLTATLWTLNLRSKTNNMFCADAHYKHDITVDMKPFVMGLDMMNDLKIYDFNLNNEGHMKLESVKADLSGSLKAAYGEDISMKHTCDLSYNDMAGTVKCSTSGDIMDTQLSHNCDVEFAGLSLISNCEARVNSEPLRFDSNIRTMALPFSLTVDALVNSDGEISLNGKHTGQLYSKLLLKAQPLALAYSHESRLSANLELPGGESSTKLDNKFESLFTPTDQQLKWEVKSKLNDHIYQQAISAYNNPENVGFDFSGVTSTDILGRKKRSLPVMQEFSMSGFLKYDKNSDCHIIELPFIESFPAAFEQLKNTVVQGLESLQQSINNLDFNQLISDFRGQLDQLPMRVSDFMQAIDLEGKVNHVNDKLDYLINEFGITTDDLETAVKKMMTNLEATLTDFYTKIRDFFTNIESFIKDGHLADKITSILTNIGDQLQALDDIYKIKQTFLKMLDVINDIVRQIDLQKLSESSAAFLQDLDHRYGILSTIEDKLSELKQAIENFDINKLMQNIKEYLLSFDWASIVEDLTDKIPSLDIPYVMESMYDVIVNWIDEYEIPNKLNAVYSYLKDLILKYDLVFVLKDFMDQSLLLVAEFRIEETVQSVTETLKSINFEFVYDKVMELLNGVTEQLRNTDFKQSIDDFNQNISSLLKTMKDFDYNEFVDEANGNIAKLRQYINDQIKTYEIIEKIEAVRDFVREIQSSVYAFLDELKNTKVADALKKLKNVIDTTFYNDFKTKLQDMLEDARQRISDMDIRDEMYIYLQRASESYSNIMAFISTQFDHLMEKLRDVFEDSDVISQIKQGLEGILGRLRKAEIEVPSFTLPFTDLVIPGFTINLNNLQEITIPASISLPEFTILNTYTIPGFTIDFEELKAKLIAFIDDIRDFEIQTPDPEDIFGDLKVLYLSDLPDLTFPEIQFSEVMVPVIKIPKLNLNNFEITMLPIPEIKFPGIPSDICIPVFGKLTGEFNLNLPQYTLVTTAKIENSTSTPKNPQFTASVTSQAKSSMEPLEYTFEAVAQVEAPRMKKLVFTETVKASHMALSVDHEGSLTLTGASAEALGKTVAKATTPIFTADLINNVVLKLSDKISAAIDTSYDHNLNMPSIETSSQVSMKQNIAAMIEPGKIIVRGETTGNGKWSIHDYTDEGTHTSNIEFDINSSIAKLAFKEETDFKALKIKKTLTAEAVSLSHITVDAKCESELPSVKKSIMVLNGEADIGDLKIALKATHDAELIENPVGSMSNSLEFTAHPFEIMLDVKNNLNSKMFFPLRLTGKFDVQQDYGVVLNSEKQLAFWTAVARFNQYKYNHNIRAENNEMDIVFNALANGEANLDFLTVPLSIPETTLPYFEITIPKVVDFSLWENAGLSNLLATPQQTFDMNLKLQYHKNPDKHSFELYLEPFYNAFSDNVNIIQAQFEVCRDNVVAHLRDSYDQAKAQYIKHKIETSSMPPKIFRVPGYTIPFLNIEVSAFRAEMPAFNYFVPKEVSTASFKIPALGFSVPSYTIVLPTLKFPVIHVPETLSEIKLPTFTLPVIQNNIVIPALGNLTLDYSFKSPVITLSAQGGLSNQSDITAWFGGISKSMFDILNGKTDFTISLTRKSGLKLATVASVEHRNVNTNHESAVSLTKGNMEASMTNTASIDCPFLSLHLRDDLTANVETKLNILSKKKLRYTFNLPLIDSIGKGNLDVKWALEALTSYFMSEVSTQGTTDIKIMDSWNFAGNVENSVDFYLDANGHRSNWVILLNSNIGKQEKQKRSAENNILMFEVDKNLAIEVSLRRVAALLYYASKNNIDLPFFDTTGNHIIEGRVELIPLTGFKAKLNIGAKQSGSLGDAALNQAVDFVVDAEKQSFTWSGKEQLASLIHACNLLMSNDESEIRLHISESVEGHLAFLKSVKLPAYQKTLWDVLKFDQVTNMNDLQALNFSSGLVYTKSMDFQNYPFIPYKLLDDGVTFSFPGIAIPIPSWVKSIPDSIRNIDKRFENTDIPDLFTPTISVPEFDVPFTDLHVEPFTIDFAAHDFHVPKVITTKAFNVMLPGLPTMSVPSFDIDTTYIEGKISFLAFTIPRYEITVSSFQLPKSFSIGEFTFSLSEIENQIENFEFPTIVIPEIKIGIPQATLNLTSGVFIPTFGALSGTFKVSFPIYNISTTASLEKKDSDLVASLQSLCTSTMIFLEYDLKADATVGYENGAMNLNGKCNLIHNDVSVDWTHVLTQNIRMKRQADSAESRHTLNVDITSPTFVDANFRFASRKDGITASASSPSSGFLGLHLLRRSPSQLYGKLFSRYLSSPEKDRDVLSGKATLRNSDKLTFQTSWNWEFFHDVIEGTKENIPAMREAVLKFLNKYHTDHFGFDLNRGSMKLKNTMSNFVERAYHEAPVSFDALQDSVQTLSDQGKELYTAAIDSLMSMNLEDIMYSLRDKVREVKRHIKTKVEDLRRVISHFLRDTSFVVPGTSRRATLLELLRDATQAADRAVDKFIIFLKNIRADINDSEFSIPGTDIVVTGNEMMDRLVSFERVVSGEIGSFLYRVINKLENALLPLPRALSQKAEGYFTDLKDRMPDISSQVDAVHANVVQFSKQHTEEAQRLAAEYKDLIKRKIQELYNSLSMERVNDGIRSFITDVQLLLYEGLNQFGELMRRASQSTAPYLKISNKKMEVEIPLPFFWKSFSEWPSHLRQ